jgi:transposase
MTQLPNPPTAEPVAFIGIDWADQAHAVCLSAADQSAPAQFSIPHTPEALAEFVAQLRTRFGGRPVAIALEQSRGGLLYALMAHEFLILYPINPVTAKRYRDAWAPSGAKNDPVDARLLWELLCKHRDRLQPWQPDDGATRQLTLLCEHRRDLVNQQTRLVQQLRAALKVYYPQALDWAGQDLATRLATDFLSKWPTLAALQAAAPPAVRRFYYAHRSRRPDLITARLAAIRAAQPLTTDPAVIHAHALRVQVLAQQLRSLLPLIGQYDAQIAALTRGHPDAFIFTSFPAVGACLLPRLISAFGTRRERYPTAAAMQMFSGVAPVTERSGKFRSVTRRYACPKFVLQTFHEYARCSQRRCEWAQAYYDYLRAKGKAHHAALRALAFKWIRVLTRCWLDRQAYDDARYMATLRRRGVPYLVAR